MSVRSVRLVVNPNAGKGEAATIAEECRERLDRAGISESAEADTVVIFGGDGTLHDFLNRPDVVGAANLDRLRIAIVPCGTANALFEALHPGSGHGRWCSIDALVTGDTSRLRPLCLATVVQDGAPPEEPTTACVVVSAALHASIVFDSERLRASHPGIERFKLAAAENVTRRYAGRLSLAGDVRRYSPSLRDFAPIQGVEDVGITIDGPFSYILLAAMTDRLEPAFIVAPRRCSDTSEGLDVVIVRPEQHSRRGASLSPTDFATEVLGPVTAAMYDGGKHVDLVYASDGVRAWRADDDPNLSSVVDYFRCRHVAWEPSPGDGNIRERLVCVDGALQEIGPNRRVVVAQHLRSPVVWVGSCAHEG